MHIGVPTAVELTALYVASYNVLTPNLHLEIVNAVAENVKFYLARVRDIGSLEHPLFLLPWVAGFGNALQQGQIHYYFALYFHITLVDFRLRIYEIFRTATTLLATIRVIAAVFDAEAGDAV